MWELSRPRALASVPAGGALSRVDPHGFWGNWVAARVAFLGVRNRVAAGSVSNQAVVCGYVLSPQVSIGT